MPTSVASRPIPLLLKEIAIELRNRDSKKSSNFAQVLQRLAEEPMPRRVRLSHFWLRTILADSKSALKSHPMEGKDPGTSRKNISLARLRCVLYYLNSQPLKEKYFVPSQSSKP
jgi:hypothetical protein